MRIFAIADLHLSTARPKPMSVFGPAWAEHPEIVARRWREVVGTGDLVLVPGDISWAMRLDEARADLLWIDALPGRKILIRGNHDYWWSSPAKVRRALPPSIIGALHRDAVTVGPVAVAGTRLWDVPGMDLGRLVRWTPPLPGGGGLEPASGGGADDEEGDAERIYQRELLRLQASLDTVPPSAERVIVMVHYPPTDPAGQATGATAIIERPKVTDCVFGHIHSLDPALCPRYDVTRGGVRYRLVAADFTGMTPVLVAEV